MPKKNNPWPQYVEWRDGRPRWGASPKLKKLGWRGWDLKDERGEYLDATRTIELANRINAAVAAWPGELVPAEFAAFAPAGATNPNAKPVLPNDERSIGWLYDEYISKLELRAWTVADYTVKIRVMLETIAELRRVSLDDLRAQDIELLRPPKFGDGPGARYDLDLAYQHIKKTRGVAMGKGCVAATSAWFKWIKFKRWTWEGENPCRMVQTEMPKGRKVAFSAAEIDALVRAADGAGLASIGDAVILGLDTTWSKQDLLAAQWETNVKAFTFTGQRKKTGISMVATLLPADRDATGSRFASPGAARQRLAEINLRQADWSDDARRLARDHILVNEATGEPWDDWNFSEAFAQVRAIASQEVGAGILSKQYRDVRDTAISWLEGGWGGVALTKMQIAARCGHSYAAVAKTTDGAYSERVAIAAETTKLLEKARRRRA